MRQYKAFFKIKFIAGLQYRAAAIAGILTQFFFGFVFIMVYYAFYESNNNIGPMDFKSLVSYIWLQQSFFALTYVFHKEKDIVSMIKDGNVAYELCRPGNMFFKWFFRIYASKLTSVSLRFIPVILISLFLPYPFYLSLPVSFLNLIAFIITLIFSSLLITSIVSVLHLCMFYTIDSEGILNFFKVVAELFSGGIVPVLFLPNILQKISNFLPFQYIGDVPFRLYVGQIMLNDFFDIILIQIFWILIFVSIGYILSKKISKKLVIQGG